MIYRGVAMFVLPDADFADDADERRSFIVLKENKSAFLCVICARLRPVNTSKRTVKSSFTGSLLLRDALLPGQITQIQKYHTTAYHKKTEHKGQISEVSQKTPLIIRSPPIVILSPPTKRKRKTIMYLDIYTIAIDTFTHTHKAVIPINTKGRYDSITPF